MGRVFNYTRGQGPVFGAPATKLKPARPPRVQQPGDVKCPVCDGWVRTIAWKTATIYLESVVGELPVRRVGSHRVGRGKDAFRCRGSFMVPAQLASL